MRARSILVLNQPVAQPEEGPPPQACARDIRHHAYDALQPALIVEEDVSFASSQIALPSRTAHR